MNSHTATLCAVILLTVQTIVLAQKTEVRVQKGKVVAETADASVTIDAGRKVVITPDASMVVTVDDPMVDDLIRIYGWVEQEKQAQRFDSASIQMVRIESENRFTLAYLLEVRNSKSAPNNTCQIENASILDDPRFYDLTGNRLSFDVDKIDARGGNYFVRFPEPVERGKEFKFICVSKLDGSMWKEGPLWHLQISWSIPRCLNYFRFVLPKSAVFVDSNRHVVSMDSFAGDATVTMRNYTGTVADGVCHIAFLWPDKDGTTLADLPPQYRGLRDEHDEDIVRVGQLQMARIVSGETFNDQGNPLAAVATLCSAIIQKDKELFISLMGNSVLKELASRQFDEVVRDVGPQLMDTFDFLSTPSWPDKPENGYEHPIYLSRKGSLLHEATVTMVYRDSKWYWGGMIMGAIGPGTTEATARKTPDAVKVSKDKANPGMATYEGLEPGRFLRRWLFLGPVKMPWHGEGYFPDAETQRQFFDADSVPLDRFESEIKIGDKNYEWSVLDSEYGIVDLSGVFKDWFMAGYAWAQIDMPEERSCTLGVGSDDSVKVWLNGELVHNHWEAKGRGVVPDDDRVPVTFKKGKNDLVLKIQNGGGAWGFACRLLEQ